MKLHSSQMQQRHTDAQTVVMLYQPAYVFHSSHFLNSFGFDGERKKITFIFITAIVCTVYSQQQSTQPSSSSSSSAIVANVHKSYIRLVHGNYFRVTTALCHLTAVVLCRQVFKSCCGKSCCVVAFVYCCGIILCCVVKFLSCCINI